MKPIYISSILALCACTASQNNQEGKAPPQDVKLRYSITKPCELVKDERCVSIRENGAERCYERLKKQARKSDANTVFVESAEEISDITDTTNNLFSDTRTVIQAKFYRCDLESVDTNN